MHLPVLKAGKAEADNEEAAHQSEANPKANPLLGTVMLYHILIF
jgi:hypothetical protein